MAWPLVACTGIDVSACGFISVIPQEQLVRHRDDNFHAGVTANRCEEGDLSKWH